MIVIQLSNNAFIPWDAGKKEPWNGATAMSKDEMANWLKSNFRGYEKQFPRWWANLSKHGSSHDVSTGAAILAQKTVAGQTLTAEMVLAAHGPKAEKKTVPAASPVKEAKTEAKAPEANMESPGKPKSQQPPQSK